MHTGLRTLFVYGTLKRGESHHSLVERCVRSIRRASVPGRLLDVGDFPALIDGEGRAYGELFEFDALDVPRILELVDRLEGFLPGDEVTSLFERRVVQVTTEDGSVHAAYAYLYNLHLPLIPLESLRQVHGGEWSGCVSRPSDRA